jgi:nitrite reductase/ring-hydroxylating ferredoxin subunit/uncharacterized membrane protein
MRSAATIKDHPIHPILVGFPVAYLAGSALAGLWARAARRPRWFRTATHMNGLGIATALAAAVPGLIDYVFAVPPKSSGKTRATNHMFANVSALALFALSRLGRRGADDRPAAWTIATELCGLGLLTTGGWLGGTLVYRNQIGVDHRYANAGRWIEEPIAPTSGEIDVAASDELDVDQMKLLRIGGRRIVLARVERGYLAFDDRCTHKGGSLADGVLVCGTVQCPWHGSQFAVDSGAVRQGPATEKIETYSVEERGGRIWLAANSRESIVESR